MLPVLRTYDDFCPKISKNTLFLAPVLTIRYLVPREQLVGCAKIHTETLEKTENCLRKHYEVYRNSAGWILRSVSVLFTVQPSKTVILGLEISSWNRQTISPTKVGLSNEQDLDAALRDCERNPNDCK